jgi:hypothetical protein
VLLVKNHSVEVEINPRNCVHVVELEYDNHSGQYFAQKTTLTKLVGNLRFLKKNLKIPQVLQNDSDVTGLFKHSSHTFCIRFWMCI